MFLASIIHSPVFASNRVNEPLQQIIKDKRVTINMKNVALDEILMAINKQSNVGYGYQDSAIDKNRKFSLSVTNVIVEQALDSLFKGSYYSYRTERNRIIIIKKQIP